MTQKGTWYCEFGRCTAVLEVPLANSTNVSALYGARTEWYIGYLYCMTDELDWYAKRMSHTYRYTDINNLEALCPIHQTEYERDIVNFSIHCAIKL